jgi:HPt (histidine-containing phosphotransfer) domain-containing protein
MSNPVIHAFFLGRAIAEVVSEQLEDALTNALSELGKFDAEQRDNLRQLVEEVQMRTDRAMERGIYTESDPTSPASRNSSEDLQEVIDELRAEIARLRSELKTYRNQSV